MALAASTVVLPASAANAVVSCPAGKNCWWEKANFQSPGLNFAGGTFVTGRCYSIYPQIKYVRSFRHNSSDQGYFYSNRDCTGRSRAVTPNTESPDIGFNAYSIRAACVTCKEGATHVLGRFTT
jgi:hypothetical protein